MTRVNEPRPIRAQKMPTLSEYLSRFSVIIITGGSSGIGCAIIKAIQEIRNDCLICNLSRSKPDFFCKKNHIHIEVDLSDTAALPSAANQVRSHIENSQSGQVLLINNSGFGDYGRTQDLDASKQTAMIDLNVRAVVDLTMQLLPALIARGGHIVNVASTAAFQATPYMSTYGATKAFVLHWSLALNQDLKGTGVRALAVCPGPTRSNFFKAAGFTNPPMQDGVNGGLDMTSEQVATQTLQALTRNKALLVTGWKNKLIAFASSKVPKALSAEITATILRKLRLEKHKNSTK